MGGKGSDLDGQVAVVADRIEFVELLDEAGPLETRDVVDALSHSRSTVKRALGELRGADLVRKADDGYVVTVPAVMAADLYRNYEATSQAVLSAKDLLGVIPDEHAPPPELLVGADAMHAEETYPVRQLETVAKRVREADTVRAYLPTLLNTNLVRVWHGAVTERGVDGMAVFDPDLLAVLQGQYPQLLSEMAADGLETFTARGPPYAVILTETADATTASVVVYENEAAIRGVVLNDSRAAVEWARAQLDRLRREGTETTSELEALNATAPAETLRGSEKTGTGTDRSEFGHELPLDLELEGFVHLSEEHFDRRTSAPPAVSWRTGFTLAEVRDGHAVDRRDAEGQNVTTRLADRLRGADDHVVVGPPGSGKSTVCMAVACEWFDRDLGPVLYRERGVGGDFESTAKLEAYLRQVDGHALVVVEDAPTDEASAVFEVMASLEQDRDVTFLVDARTHEWEEVDAFEVATLEGPSRRSVVERIRVPDLDEAECERFVAQFEDLVDDGVPLSGSELFSLVEEGTAGQDDAEAPAGAALVAQYHLSRRHDPAADDERSPTALDEQVRRTYRSLADADQEYTTDVAVLAALLNAAGLPVSDEYLLAVAPDGAFHDVAAAISYLEGRLVFERDDPGLWSDATTYRTRHRTWAMRFLEAFSDVEGERAQTVFGRCVTELLALSDDARKRRRIQRHLDPSTPYLHQVEADPQNWADQTVKRIFEVGTTQPSLAPLFGEPSADTVELPNASSAWTAVQIDHWLGQMYQIGSDFDRAERAYRSLCDPPESLAVEDARALPASVAEPIDDEPVSESDISAAELCRNYWQGAGFLGLGHVAWERGNLADAEEHTERALEHFRTASTPGGEARALCNLGEVVHGSGRIDAAKEYFEEGLDLFQSAADRRGEARARLHLGNLANKRGDLEVAADHARATLESYRDIGDSLGEIRARFLLGNALHNLGEFDAAVGQYEESLARCRETGHRHNEAALLTDLGLVVRDRGELARAQEHFEASLDVFRDIGDEYRSAMTLTYLGDVARERGDLARAEEHCHESLERFEAVGDPRGRAAALIHLGKLARDRGGLETARERLDESLALLRESGDRQNEASVHFVLGTVARKRGELETAEDHLDQSVELYRSIGVPHGEGKSLLERARASADRGDRDQARARYEEAADCLLSVDADETDTAVAAAVDACERHEDVDAAREWCRRAVEFAEQTDRAEMRDRFARRQEGLRHRDGT